VKVRRDIRAVAFDAVGTLIHPEPAAALVYAEVGRRFASRLPVGEVRRRFGAAFARQEAIDRSDGLRTGEEREVRRWREIVAEVLDDVSDPEGCFQALYEHFARPGAWRCEPETAGVLEELARRGYPLALASNYDERLRRVLEGLPALRPVGHIVISAEVGWRKPAPQFFAALCRTLEATPESVLFVGDDPGNDYDGATSAGLHALLLDPEGQEVAGAATVRELAQLLPMLVG
jgi:putative hydrolase of the HAD superfamily